jgi:hypothetical protein
MTIGILVSRLRKLEDKHTEHPPAVVIVSHRAVYSESEIPEGATLYATEAQAIEAFNEGQSRPVINIGIADFSINAGEPIGWITESTGNPDTASTIIHDNIPRRIEK